MGYNWFLLYFAWLLNQEYCIIMHLLWNLLLFSLQNLARDKHQVTNISHSDLQIVHWKMNSSQCSLKFYKNEKKSCYSAYLVILGNVTSFTSWVQNNFSILLTFCFYCFVLSRHRTEEGLRVLSRLQVSSWRSLLSQMWAFQQRLPFLL